MSKLGNIEKLRQAKRAQTDVDSWFYVQEVKMYAREAMLAAGIDITSAYGNAELLCRTVEKMPLSILPGTLFAGSQDGAFSPSYALINPNFKVEEFAGYCDPCAIYNDIAPTTQISSKRIEKVRKYWEKDSFVTQLYDISERYQNYTAEVVFFMEPVTGHTIPDLRPLLQNGIPTMQQQALASNTEYGKAMAHSLDAVLILAERYKAIMTDKKAKTVLDNICHNGAGNLREAIQLFMLLWEVMVIEQAPNPYAFSVGNLDRILDVYYVDESFDEAVELIRHLLCFFQVGNRCWAISQNILVGGRDEHGNDLTNKTTEAVLEAFFRSNDPQPALSVKLHKNSPDKIYQNMERFFLTPGHLTPSLFNDDSIFPMLQQQGIAVVDLPDYAIAGCQEPLIMGKSSLNTTNSWLNLGKILELALNDGKSTITGKQIAPTWQELNLGDSNEVFNQPEKAFFTYLEVILPLMEKAGNECTTLLGKEKPVPFSSALHDGFSSFRDMRNPQDPGMRYHASGCLIHGLSVVADAFIALKNVMNSALWSSEAIGEALQSNFASQPQIREFLQAQPKYGNNIDKCDETAVRIITEVCQRIKQLKNPAGKSFLADWSTPSTHLLYGYWVGATPDGRAARTMLGYGVDPRPEAVTAELPERLLSYHKLPYQLLTGGYASHLGLSPLDITGKNRLGKIAEKVIKPLFQFGETVNDAPFYVYFNIDTAEHLNKILKNPQKLVPSGVYIMRIHGTFVNFLDLSPAIQKDIIERLNHRSNAA